VKGWKKAAISSLAVTVLGGLIVEWWKDFPILRWTEDSLAAIWRWLRVSVVLERWSLYILLLMAAALCLVVVLGLRRKGTVGHFTNYTTDKFFDIVWFWRYNRDQIDPTSFIGICPKCDLQLVYADSSTHRAVPHTSMVCNECGYSQQFDGRSSDLQHKLSLRVDRELRRKDAARVAP
jgi:hypothetical protein